MWGSPLLVSLCRYVTHTCYTRNIDIDFGSHVEIPRVSTVYSSWPLGQIGEVMTDFGMQYWMLCWVLDPHCCSNVDGDLQKIEFVVCSWRMNRTTTYFKSTHFSQLYAYKHHGKCFHAYIFQDDNSIFNFINDIFFFLWLIFFKIDVILLTL